MKKTPAHETGGSGLSCPRHPKLISLHGELCRHVRAQEAVWSKGRAAPDTLCAHLERVATLAVHLAGKEGVDTIGAELAGLFHDAGKFTGGCYHAGDTPEELSSVEILREMGSRFDMEPSLIEEVSRAILELYKDDPQPTPLGMVLFDADNLDKLGPLGVANYFIKAGLRGRGMTTDTIIGLTVELTYARHAPRCLFTNTGRGIARRRAQQTTTAIRDFLEALREDGLFDAVIEVISVSGLDLEVVTPGACSCGGRLAKRTWEEPGLKCSEIHLEMACSACGSRHEIRFCRPRLVV